MIADYTLVTAPTNSTKSPSWPSSTPGGSIARKDIKEYANEACAGTNDNQPQFQQMLADALAVKTAPARAVFFSEALF